MKLKTKCVVLLLILLNFTLFLRFYRFIWRYVCKNWISGYVKQNCINVFCGADVLNLTFKCNVVSVLTSLQYESHSYFRNIFSKEEWLLGCANPVIFHYLSSNTPWDRKVVIGRDRWWDYAEASKFFGDIASKYQF